MDGLMSIGGGVGDMYNKQYLGRLNVTVFKLREKKRNSLPKECPYCVPLPLP